MTPYRLPKEKYDVQVGIRTAEDIKKQIGGAVPRNEEIVMVAKGRCVHSGMPKSIEVTSNEIYHCLKPLLQEISSAAQIMFERTSPQLVADIVTSGIILTGGSAELYGMDEFFKQEMNLDVTVTPHPNLYYNSKVHLPRQMIRSSRLYSPYKTDSLVQFRG